MNINRNYRLHMLMRLGFHVAAIWWLIQEDFHWQAGVVLAVAYFISILSITVGYHRYFSHKAFKTYRVVQFLMGWLGCCQLQGGPIVWASVHRHHHQYSDKAEDLHSPKRGVFWAHMGWLMEPKTYDVAFRPLKDLQRFPELVWLDRWNFVPPILCFGALWGIGELWQLGSPDSPVDGMMLLMWGGVIRLVVVWHVTWCINSLCHLWGFQTFDTSDDSRNNFIIAVLACGEGWHNNHHYDPSCARSGLDWTQPDTSFVVIRMLEWLGLTWSLRAPRGDHL